MRTGIDIVKISRINSILADKRDSFYKRLFTESEVEYISGKNHDSKTVSGMFATKEAVSKLLGTGIGNIGWKDIEISHDANNKPYIIINDILRYVLSNLNIDAIDISISHEDEYAVAIAAGFKTDANLSKQPICIDEDMKKLLPKRKLRSHKGNYGRVAIIAGSRGMTGAPYLVSTAALKSGSGLVYCMVTKDIEDIMSIKLTEVIVKGFTQSKECLELLNNIDGVVLGPGLGQGTKQKELVANVLNSFQGPIVLDADGINAIDNSEILSNRKGLTVITPHPGELARLLNKDIKEIQDNRIYYSKYTAEKYNVITVLKGYQTIVAYKDSLFKNTTGNPGMATAGSGDVLSGMIISFICQGIKPFQACKLGIYCHGLAGDLARNELGEYGLIAGDILNHIPKALKLVQD
mgnify:FL=1